MDERCQGCPVASGPCVSRIHPRYCELKDDPFYRSRIVARSAGMEPERPERLSAAGRTVPEELRLGKLAIGCPHRDCNQGCSKALCKPGGRRPGSIVYMSDCKDCIAESESRPPPG